MLGLQMRKSMGIGTSHTPGLHTAHHGSCLADRAIGTGNMLHTRRHSRLPRIRAWASHAWMLVRHALWMHATIVRVARGHHPAGSGVRAVASQSREGRWVGAMRPARAVEGTLADCGKSDGVECEKGEAVLLLPNHACSTVRVEVGGERDDSSATCDSRALSGESK